MFELMAFTVGNATDVKKKRKAWIAISILVIVLIMLASLIYIINNSICTPPEDSKAIGVSFQEIDENTSRVNIVHAPKKIKVSDVKFWVLDDEGVNIRCDILIYQDSQQDGIVNNGDWIIIQRPGGVEGESFKMRHAEGEIIVLHEIKYWD